MVVTHAHKSGQPSAEDLTKCEVSFQSSCEGTMCSEKIQMKLKHPPALQTHNEFVERVFNLLYLCNN